MTKPYCETCSAVSDKFYLTDLHTINEFRRVLGPKFKLHSTFTHVEGKSQLTSNWTHIMTTYCYKNLLIKIVTIQETKESEKQEFYYFGFKEDGDE